MKSIFKACLFVLGVSSLTSACIAQLNDKGERPKQESAAKAGNPLRTMILSATRAASRLVAVGERGVVLLSDDDGKTYRQASSVPTTVTLTSVRFVDGEFGWAVGHWGVILSTEDGGEHWRLLRDDVTVDQPLFSVAFKDRQNGIAAGLFSLVLITTDGGITWRQVKLPPAHGAKASDVNLFTIFQDQHGAVLIGGEQGLVYRTSDYGSTWEVLNTGARGTIWAGTTLDNGTLLVAGLRGSLYRSEDAGRTWCAVDTKTNSSITDITQMPNGQVMAVGLNGLVLQSNNRGASFSLNQRKDQRSLTAIAINGQGTPVLFSQNGVIKTSE